MKKIISILLCIALLIPFFVEPLAVNAAKKQAETIKDLEAELAALKQEKIDNQSAKNQTQAQINAKKDAIYKAYQEQEEIKVKVTEAESKIVESNEEIVKSTNEINELLRFMQITDGENAYLEYISGAESTSDLVMRVAVIEQITNYNKEVVGKLETLIAENEALKV